ncbi:MAG TPA: PAS domain-containing protein, partial [Oscillatoriales cyanobacterium M4454_W2019_049]|nr:PAS domain-containing protein [Oscillatoriales cyanobacterium M4454_W2019_049]
FWKDRNSVFLGCNRNLARDAGLNSPQDIIGKTDYDLPWKQEESDFYRECDRQVMDANQPQLHIIETQRQANGRQIWLDTSKVPLRDEEGNVIGILGTYEDITERKQTEAQLAQKTKDLEQTLRQLKRMQIQLLQSEKMSSLGQLVAGVAHEINNPVSFIYGNLVHIRNYTQDLLGLLERYRESYPDPVPNVRSEIEAIDLEFLREDLPKTIESMQVGADRIKNIVLSLRNFSRMDEAALKKVDLKEGIDSTLLVLQHRLKATGNRPEIDIIVHLENLPPIECYAGQLNQVFMNLLSNAIDAIESRYLQHETGGETIDKGTSQTDRKLDKPYPGKIRISTQLLENNWVSIQIADNGVGIPEDVRSRIFDPLFTTKPIGKGTGMGLSICYQIIVDRHGGTLECTSDLGRGTEFEIRIPQRQIDTGESRSTISHNLMAIFSVSDKNASNPFPEPHRNPAPEKN